MSVGIVLHLSVRDYIVQILKTEEKMSGIFIYTASGDSEGTLGGLVRQGRPDAFPRILRKAVSEAQT